MAAVSSRLSVPVRRIPPLPTINDLLKLYKLRARKQLSQNFLLNQRLCDKIVKAAGNIHDFYVCEVGPGPGNITRSILKKNIRKLIVIEKDLRFKPTLEMLSEAVDGKMDIAWGDILDYNLETMFPSDLKTEWDNHPPKLCILGNLPFNISTPLIIKWLRQVSVKSGPFFFGRTKLTLTFQAEVAERLFAPPGHPQRSRLSIMAQHLCHVNYNFMLSGSAFLPPPDVNVGVVTFTPLRNPHITQPFIIVDKVVRSVFHFRQKYCIRGVELLVPDETFAKKILLDADVNPHARPYQLSMPEFSRICQEYHKLILEYPKIADYDYRA